MNHPEGVTLRELPPPPRKRVWLPRWEVLLDGRVIGRIEETKLGGAKNNFFFAWGRHPDTGREYRLEGSIYLDEKVEEVVRFHRNPLEFEQHLGL